MTITISCLIHDVKKAKLTSHKGKHGPQYFVLTAKEVYESKLAYIKAKEKKKKDLEARKRVREIAKQSKVKGSAKKSVVSAIRITGSKRSRTKT